MLAVTLEAPNARDPLAAIALRDREPPADRPGWVRVRLRAAAVNHHDVWSMRGAGVDPAWLPVTLGSDGAGVDEDGNEVIVHALVADPDAGGGLETSDPGRRLLGDGIDGTFAEEIVVPRRNLIPKPPELAWEDAACLPTAWLTAYRMLFGRIDLPPGSTILVQGSGGGLATALVALGRAAGLRVWVTGRDEAKRERAVSELGAHAAFAPGERLPERVDAVMESVGEATWAHSLRSLRPGGTIVVAGATTGADPKGDLSRVFLNGLSVVGTAMGTRDELRRLAQLCVATGLRPAKDSVRPLADAVAGIERLVEGSVFGKVVLTVA